MQRRRLSRAFSAVQHELVSTSRKDTLTQIIESCADRTAVMDNLTRHLVFEMCPEKFRLHHQVVTKCIVPHFFADRFHHFLRLVMPLTTTASPAVAPIDPLKSLPMVATVLQYYYVDNAKRGKATETNGRAGKRR